MPHIVASEVVDLIVSEAIHCPMEYYLGEVLPSHTEWLPQVWNMPMPAGVTQTSLDFYNLGVSVPEGRSNLPGVSLGVPAVEIRGEATVQVHLEQGAFTELMHLW